MILKNFMSGSINWLQHLNPTPLLQLVYCSTEVLIFSNGFDIFSLYVISEDKNIINTRTSLISSLKCYICVQYVSMSKNQSKTAVICLGE